MAAAVASSGRDGQTASFDGVVLDFESLRAGQKANYTAFLQELRAIMGQQPIYVAVHPVLNDSAYYDGYDYAAIGQLADRVILMAYDFDAKSLTESEMAQGYTQTPMSPLDQIYSAIKACLNGRHCRRSIAARHLHGYGTMEAAKRRRHQQYALPAIL